MTRHRMGRQSWWKTSTQPIWKQRNDDDRIGKKFDDKHCQLCKHDVSKDMSAAYWFDGKPTCINCAAKVEAITEDD